MENQLITIVQQSGLEQTKAQYILDNFQNYFSIASEWEQKAKTIVITDESQKTEMKMAREARLFLREKRLDVEKARKQLKEQSLREGKAIDGIANVLKALIEPIEEYLERQEKFAEIKEAERMEVLKIEAEKQAELERLAKEKAEAEERERIKLENERLHKEAEERERQMKAEREKAEVEKRALEEKARKEAEERERLENENKRIVEEQKRKENEARLEQERIEMEEKANIKKELEEKEKIEKGKKYQAFLSKNGYTEETKENYQLVRTGSKIELFKKIDEITI